MTELDPNPATCLHRLAIAALATQAAEVSREAAIGFDRLRDVAYGSDDGMYDFPAMCQIAMSLNKIFLALNELFPIPTFRYKEGAPIPRMPPRPGKEP